jgi:hypothetical protein
VADEEFEKFWLSTGGKLGADRLYCLMGWRAATEAAEEKFTAGRTLAGVAPTTTQGNEICPVTAMQCEKGRVQVVCIRQGLYCPHAGQTSPVA